MDYTDSDQGQDELMRLAEDVHRHEETCEWNQAFMEALEDRDGSVPNCVFQHAEIFRRGEPTLFVDIEAVCEANGVPLPNLDLVEHFMGL